MPVLDGITISEKLNELKKNNEHPFVVFITCKDNLVFKALKSYPYSFIRKSDVDTDLINCIVKINEKFKSNNTIVIHSCRDDIIVNMMDIIYLEKQKNYVIYHNLEQTYSVRSSIDIEFKKLNYNFIKPHIGYVVNNEYISSFLSDRIILQNNVSIPVSKKYKSVKEDYFKWLGEKYV
jgi:DNA-binding LytR/AlgR family response regulator